MDVAIVPQLIATSRASDGSGKVATVTLNRRELGQRLDAEDLTAQAQRLVPEVTMHAAGGLATVVPDPVPHDVDGLERALYAHQPRGNGPKSAVRAVADLYRTLLRRPPALPVKVPAVFSYVLYLEQDRRSNTS